MTAGFQRNDLIIVAARPSVGKPLCLKHRPNVATKPMKASRSSALRWAPSSWSCGCSVRKATSTPRISGPET
ncbi:DnaB-like helicase C-terminal domain-containing protein [Bacillus licheniformis]|nr:DnaB-like helicase C-terminal domain-containing protein [Bacillus licheniformis]